MAESLRFDRVAHEYDETRGGEQRGRMHADLLHPLLPQSGAVLEIGIGTGLVAAALSALGHDVTGVDLSAPMLARARARIGPRVALGDAERLPFADGSAAAAYSVWVLHLVGDRDAVFREARRVVVPEGRYVVVGADPTVPPEQDVLGRALWQMRTAVRGGVPDDDDPGQLVTEASAAGWQVETASSWPGESYTESAREMVARVESRTWSWLWAADADTWQRCVAPVLNALLAREDVDRPQVRQSRQHVLVLRGT